MLNGIGWSRATLAGLAALALLAGAAPAKPALARPSDQTPGVATVQIDEPAAGARVRGAVNVAGWAADLTATDGAGVDQIVVTLGGPLNQGRRLGNAQIGQPRPAVAAQLGNPNLANAGFTFTWDATAEAPGPRSLFVNAHSPRGVWAYASVDVTVDAAPAPAASPPAATAPPPPPPPAATGPVAPAVGSSPTVTSTAGVTATTGAPPPPPPGGPPPAPGAAAQTNCPPPVLVVESPPANGTVAANATLVGWAVTPGSPSGTGVTAVQATLDAPDGPPAGTARLGIQRPDVAANQGGPQFAGAGWQLPLDARAVPPGPHTLYIAATGCGGVTVQGVNVTVTAAPAAPAANLPAGALPTPANVAAVHVGSKAVRVTWDPIPGVLGYYVYRFAGDSPPPNPGSPVSWELAGDANTGTFTDSTGVAGVNYFYSVQAYSFGNATSGLSVPVKVAVPY